MRVIIAAAGGQHKWAGALPVPSHLVPVPGPDAGAPLLARTAAQALRHTRDVHLTCPAGDTRYETAAGPHVTVHHQQPDTYPSEYAATRRIWNPHGRTVLLLGDVYFTDAAFNLIATNTDPDYRCFGRYGPSPATGTPYGEIFAASWWPNNHPNLDRHLTRVHRLRAAGTITRPPGWMLLRAVQGTPLGRHRAIRPWFVDVTTALPGDITDDLDTGADYARHPAFRGGAGPAR